jgi:MMP 1-O-methyltransferase
VSRLDELTTLADSVKGFMPRNEGLALTHWAFQCGQTFPGGTWVEIGAWCGKSTIYLGAAAEATSSLLYSLDHHHGSEEQQRGWEYFDETLIDPRDGRLNTLPTWQANVATSQLEQSVVGLVGESSRIARHFGQPLELLFIDGGHGDLVAWADYREWAPKIVVGGLLLIHDVFEDPREGGRPPFEIYQAALRGEFIEVFAEGSLRVLQRH